MGCHDRDCLSVKHCGLSEVRLRRWRKLEEGRGGHCTIVPSIKWTLLRPGVITRHTLTTCSLLTQVIISTSLLIIMISTNQWSSWCGVSISVLYSSVLLYCVHSINKDRFIHHCLTCHEKWCSLILFYQCSFTLSVSLDYRKELRFHGYFIFGK